MQRSPLAAVFLSSHRVLRAIQGGSQALFEGFWMGVLPDSVKDAISQQSYGAGQEYSSEPYLDSGLQFWEDIAIQRFFRGKRILVGAAGAGREIIALRRAGYDADGFECCRPMVEAGRRALLERGLDARLEWAAPCTVPSDAGEYDAAIVGWNGYTYISPRGRRVEFLKSLRTHLRKDAPILLSGAFRPGRDRVATLTARFANSVRQFTFRAPVFEPGDTFPGRPRHTFRRQQVERELAEAGFHIDEFYVWGVFFAAVATMRDPLVIAPGTSR